MKNKGDEQGKTRWTRYQTGYHLVWIPKYRKKVLVGELQKELKGYTSKMLREKFPFLKRKCGRDRLWTSAYYVGTAGEVSSETIIRYIIECQGK